MLRNAPLQISEMRWFCCSAIMMVRLQVCTGKTLQSNKTHVASLLSAVEFFCPLLLDVAVTTKDVQLLQYSSLLLFFALQHSRGFLLSLWQLHGNRLGDFYASAGVFPPNVFRFCGSGNPHWTHLSCCILTHLVKRGCLCEALCVFPCQDLKSLTHRLVSETLWLEEDSITGVWHDDHLCISSLWPGRRDQTVRWVHTWRGPFSKEEFIMTSYSLLLQESCLSCLLELWCLTTHITTSLPSPRSSCSRRCAL